MNFKTYSVSYGKFGAFLTEHTDDKQIDLGLKDTLRLLADRERYRWALNQIISEKPSASLCRLTAKEALEGKL